MNGKSSIAHRILALLLTLAIAVVGLAGCQSGQYDDHSETKEKTTKTPTATELITERINAFVTAYNDGDMTATLNCFDATTRNALQAMLNLMDALVGKVAGLKIAMSDMFSLGVALADGDFMTLKVMDVTMTSNTTGIAQVAMSMTGSDSQIVYFMMIYEHDGWYIQDMTDDPYASFEETTRRVVDSETDTETETGNGHMDIVETQTKVDPFTGIQCVVTGISPYCEISLNNQNCDANAQRYVTYSLDKETYANGDTAVIRAELSWRANDQYLLTATEYTFKVQGQAEYITSVDGLDLSFLKGELQDYMDSQCSAAIGEHDAFGEDWICKEIVKVNVSLQETYLSALKTIRIDSMSEDVPFNKLSFIYRIIITANDGSDILLYMNASATNIVCYPDGRIGWGTASAETYDFTRETVFNDYNQCVASTITAHKVDYNISVIN